MFDDDTTITIKRYSNRKLYDTRHSHYVTLSELGELIRQGKQIRVIDNDTKEDLTEVTITQILMAQQKKKQKGIIHIVQEQAGILLQRIAVPVQQIRDEALRQVENQVGKFMHRADTAVTHSQADAPHADADEQKIKDEEKPSPSILTRLEMLKHASDEKLLSYLLFQRVEQLEAEVEALKQRVASLERADDEAY